VKLSTKALIVAFAIQIGLILYRTVLLNITGYLTSDEANYALNAMQGTIYGTRYFYGYFNIGLFRLFSIDSFPSFEALFPFYLVFWVGAFLFIAYKIVGLLTDNERTKALVLLAISFFPAFSLHSIEFVSEQVALTMGAIGVYAWLRFDRQKEVRWSVLSAAAFVAATYTRTEYAIFLLVGAAYFVYRARLKAIPFVIIALLIGVPVPQSGSGGAINAGASALVTGGNLIQVIINIPNNVGSPPVTNQSTGTQSQNTVTNQSQIPHGSPPPGNANYVPVPLSVLGIAKWGLILFVIGFIGAFGVFGLLGIGVLKLKSKGELALVISAVLIFLIVTVYDSQWHSFYTSQGIGTLIRYANPMTLGFLIVGVRGFDWLGNRKGLALFVIALVALGAASPILIQKAQGNLGLTYSVTSTTLYGPLAARDILTARHTGNYTIYINNDDNSQLLTLRGFPLIPDKAVSVAGDWMQSYFQNHTAPFYLMNTHAVGTNCTGNAENMGYSPVPEFMVEGYCTWDHVVLLNSSTGSLTEVFPP
jgi:hypothetical protein